MLYSPFHYIYALVRIRKVCVGVAGIGVTVVRLTCVTAESALCAALEVVRVKALCTGCALLLCCGLLIKLFADFIEGLLKCFFFVLDHVQILTGESTSECVNL